ncbi:MAG TPA: AsmA family protein [Burkholderiales bacterium]|nr:AsmA family protein [Burkholderiales bacterium]
MKYLKYGLYAILGLVALCAAAAAYIAAAFDPNAYRPELQRLVKEKTGRTLAIDGDIRLTYFPQIGVRLGRATLSERASDAEFAGVDGMRVALALLPLLRKQVVVDDVTVEGLRVRLTKGRDGKTNVDDLVAESRETAPAQGPARGAPTAPAIGLDVRGIHVSNARFSYQDEQTGARYAVSGLSFRIRHLAPGVPARFDLATDASSSAPPLDLHAQASGALDADFAHQTFRVAGLRLGVTGSAANVTGLRANLGADLEAQPAARTYQLSGLKLDLAWTMGSDKFDARVELPALALRGDALSVEQLVATVGGGVAGFRPAVAKLAVPKLDADLRRQTANADLAATVDESNLEARLGVAGFARPFLRFDASIDKLNLDRYLPQEQSGAAGQQPAGAARPERPFDLSPLKALNLDGRLRIGELIASNVKAEDVRIDVKAENGRIDLDPLAANLYQGSVKGRIGIDANQNRFVLRQNLSGVSIGPLLHDALRRDLLEGRGDVGIDVTAAGDTVSALKRSLSGNAKASLRDGAIKGIDLARSIRSAANALSFRKDVESAASSAEKTDFTQFSASFTIRNGRAHNDDLSVKSPFLRVSGAGDVDLAAGAVDYLARASIVATAAGQGGEEAAGLAGLTVPVRVSGPFASLKYRLELGSVLAEPSKRRLQEQKEALKSRLQEKLLGGSAAGGAQPSQAAPGAQKPEDELKKKLKDLLR